MIKKLFILIGFLIIFGIAPPAFASAYLRNDETLYRLDPLPSPIYNCHDNENDFVANFNNLGILIDPFPCNALGVSRWDDVLGRMDQYPDGKVYFIELTQENQDACRFLSYDECLSGYAVDSSIVNYKDGGSQETPSSNLQAPGIANTSPEVKLTTEISGVWRGQLPISYSATDPDSDKGGLKSQPVIIFYSNDGGITLTELAKDQPSAGVFNFDTTTVQDGTNYKIRIVALDGYDSFGEIFSGTFSVDNTGPTFDVAISPALPKEKDTITLKITSSEELKEAPKLQITQKGAEPKTVALSGSKNKFSASYYIERGSGKATISLSGEDLAGNIGNIITAGGSFFVDFYGPPPPAISSPTNNQIFSQPTISVVGTSQPNAQIILNLNGINKYTAQTSNNGSFKIDNITLSAANKGYNTLSLAAINEKGEESSEVVLKIKLNSPPKISSNSIGAKETLAGQKEIAWTSFDSNDDKLVFSIEYSNDDGSSWDYIASDLTGNSYKIDTLQLADGYNYLLKITADDGTEKTSQIFKNVIIKNNLPYISLDIPANYFTSNTAPVLTGRVIGSEQNITLAEYSLDGGASWQKAIALDGQFDSLTEKIKIPIQGPLKDGKYTVLIRATDALNRSVKISRSFSVDTVAPFIELPLLGKTIGNNADTNQDSNGLQITLPGKTEPKAKIELVLEGNTYKTTSDEKGEFEVKNVTLPLHGSNKISLTSSDLAGNITKINGVIISNNPPLSSILSPKEGEFLTGVEEISWEVKDPDNDPVSIKILYQKKNGEWAVVADGPGGSSQKWDVSKIANGDYKIKFIFSDGLDEVEKILAVSVDTVAPKISFSGPPMANTAQLAFSGQATDDFSGIQYAEYSSNDKDWYKALITSGYQTRKASFVFRLQPNKMEDGNYKILTRATDRAGNITYSEPENLLVDTTPPAVGSILISSDALILFPNKAGVIELFKDTPYKILFSVARDAKEVILSSKEKTYNINFDKATSLWEGEITFLEPGDNSLIIKTQDEMGNSQSKEIAFLKIIPLGVISSQGDGLPIQGAEVALSVFDQAANSWSLWDGQAFGQKNPQQTSAKGEYGFLVPPGKYSMKVSKWGFGTVKTQELQVENNYLINLDIPLTVQTGLFNKIIDYLIK